MGGRDALGVARDALAVAGGDGWVFLDLLHAAQATAAPTTAAKKHAVLQVP